MQTSQSTFKYHELEGSAKDKARQHYIEHWIIDDWYDSVYYDFKTEGVEKGFEIEDIRFTGFWSQGDGASWSGTVFLPDWLKHLPESIGRDCWIWLMEDGWIHDRLNIYSKPSHYCHSGNMSVGNVEVYSEDGDGALLKTDCILKGAPVDAVWALIMNDKACAIHSVEELEEAVIQDARTFADNLYKTLESAYEAECSDDNVGETYDANGVLFNEEGVILK